MTTSEVDRYMLSNMPHFVATNYAKMLNSQNPKQHVDAGLYTYNLGLRALTIGLVSQYLIRDRFDVISNDLNYLLEQNFATLTLDKWQQLLFATLHAYQGKRELLFMKELYDFYWDTEHYPHRRRYEVEKPFARLTQIALGLQTSQVVPQSADEWSVLASEVEMQLREVLELVAFIGNYDLIRIIDYTATAYKYELHKGNGPIRVYQQSISSHADLGLGWFYLRRGTEDLLPLHPFVIFWENEDERETDSATDIAVYDKFIYQRMQYLLSSLNRTFIDEHSVAAFVSVLYTTIEEAKRERQKADKLAWWQLRDICTDITKQRMATVRRKYRPELYLQREKTRDAFERFLNSDKRSFVLIGKSGVGKSNFFLAMEEALRDKDEICVLMYDAVNLQVEPSILQMVTDDFDNRLVLADRRIGNLLHEIARIDGIEGRTVLFVVDAINENAQAKELLRQLDEMVQGPWPWLKVVFSSRPETWQTIKRGVRLADDLYFRDVTTQAMEVELQEFSYSEKMDQFRMQDELPKVYEKYQRNFNLTTSFSELSLELREVLRDPLSLWLVASTYHDSHIPPTVQIVQLVEAYISALLSSNRLRTDDLHLLEERLVPLMIKEGSYLNVLTVAEIDAAGEGLFESIYSEQILSNNQKVNQSFDNLLNAEILVRQSEGKAEKISFKYERFYEYFIGKALYKAFQEHSDTISLYSTWLVSLQDSPFLWGAVKTCLQFQLLDALSKDQLRQAVDLCSELAQLNNQRIKEILIAALTELGRDDTQRIRIIAHELLGKQRSLLRSLLNREESSAQCPAAKQVAINVAVNLKLPDVLEYALMDFSPAVRAVAMRSAYILWRSNPSKVYALLKNLTDNSTGAFNLPNTQVFESCIGLSLLILFDDFKNPETTQQLRDIWRPTIRRLLWVNPQNLGGKRERLKEQVRSIIMRVIARFVVRAASEVPSHSLLNIPEFKQFYVKDSKLSERRRLATKLISCLRMDEPNLSSYREYIVPLITSPDFILALLAINLFQKYVAEHPDTTLPFLRELFDQAISTNPHSAFVGAVLPSGLLSDDNVTNPETRQFFLEVITTIYETTQAKWKSKLREYRFSYLDLMCFIEAEDLIDTPLTPTAKKYVQKMVENNDIAWISDIIDWEITAQGVEMGRLKFVFDFTRRVINSPDPVLQEKIVELLARLYVYYPDQVDDFMFQLEFSDVQVQTVHNRTPSETMGDLMNLRALTFYHQAIVFGSSPEFWDQWLQVLSLLPTCNRIDEFVVPLMKFAVNTVFGARIFNDLPDRKTH